VVATYPIALTKASKHVDADRAFIAFLASADGRSIMEKYGFGAP
jgi:ABC-type molybdate transport system substrate-binding protein